LRKEPRTSPRFCRLCRTAQERKVREIAQPTTEAMAMTIRPTTMFGNSLWNPTIQASTRPRGMDASKSTAWSNVCGRAV
jgi:hypothetical protein